MRDESVPRTDDELLSAYIGGRLSGVESDKLIDRLANEQHLAERLEFIRASDVAERAVLSTVYDKQKLPSVIRLIETTQPESFAEKIAAFAAPYFQPTVGVAAAAALLVGLLLGGLIF